MSGIDHYLRIKHYANLKVSWTKIVLFVLFQAIMTLIGLLLSTEYTFHPVYYTTDFIILGEIILLQKMPTPEDVCNELKI